MFFIGITGQLITLILTVCLPFVLLVSFQPKSVLPEKANQFEVQKNLQSLDSSKINSAKINFSLAYYLQNAKIEFEELLIQKIPQYKFRVRWELLYTESSGNKAPPEMC